MARCVAVIVLQIMAGYLLVPMASAANRVPVGYVQVAKMYGIPSELLYAVALSESSVVLSSGRFPWPWTINVAGKGYHYSSRLEAWTSLSNFLKSTSRKRIDVGISQINLGWNGHHFNSTWDTFDPYLNLNAAAAILRSCYGRNSGSWLDAAGCFHRPSGGLLSERYKSLVNKNLNTLSTGHFEETDVTFTRGLIWIEPKWKE